MKKISLYQLFLEELNEIYCSVKLILKDLPTIIESVSYADLKEALSSHFHEIEKQVIKIIEIFTVLNMHPKIKCCCAMEDLIKEIDYLIQDEIKSSTLDVAIIGGIQKIEHYQIATFTSLINMAKHLNYSCEIIQFLTDSLGEELAILKKLTRLAEGTFFIDGIYHEAAKGRIPAMHSSRRKFVI